MKHLLLLIPVVIALGACETVPDEFGYGDPVKPLTKKEKMQITARNALLEQQYSHIEKGALTNAEKAYRSAPKSQGAAFEYAHLLRKVDMVAQAEMVLKPFAINPASVNEDILVEYAKIQLKQGDFETAQIFAQEAMQKLDSAQSRMVLGIAVDAQGHHQAAENHFRQALKLANLDVDLQNSIKNNLALCLIAQNKNSEAQSLLQSIKSMHGDMDGGVIKANKNLLNKL